jgi:hypothetical protein
VLIVLVLPHFEQAVSVFGSHLHFFGFLLWWGPPAFPADLARGLFAVFAFVPGEPQGVASDAFLPWPLDAGAGLVFVLGFGIVKMSLADVAGFLDVFAAAGDEIRGAVAFLAFVDLVWFSASAAEFFSFRPAFFAVGLVLLAGSAAADLENRLLAVALFSGPLSVFRGFPTFFCVVSPVGLATFALDFGLFGHGFLLGGFLFPCGPAEVGS